MLFLNIMLGTILIFNLAKAKLKINLPRPGLLCYVPLVIFVVTIVVYIVQDRYINTGLCLFFDPRHIVQQRGKAAT